MTWQRFWQRNLTFVSRSLYCKKQSRGKVAKSSGVLNSIPSLWRSSLATGTIKNKYRYCTIWGSDHVILYSAMFSKQYSAEQTLHSPVICVESMQLKVFIIIYLLFLPTQLYDQGYKKVHNQKILISHISCVFESINRLYIQIYWMHPMTLFTDFLMHTLNLHFESVDDSLYISSDSI